MANYDMALFKGLEMKIILLLVLTLISGILYRIGGSKNGHKLVRRMGVPLIGLLTMLFVVNVKVSWYIHLLAFGLYFGLITTYWDSVFGYDNFYAHGFGCAMAYLPYAIAGGAWLGFVIRLILATLLCGLWSEEVDDDVAEEVGRGIILTGTIGAMLL